MGRMCYTRDNTIGHFCSDTSLQVFRAIKTAFRSKNTTTKELQFMQRSCVRKRLKHTKAPVRTSSEKDVGILTHSEQLKGSVTRANNRTCARCQDKQNTRCGQKRESLADQVDSSVAERESAERLTCPCMC